MRARQLITIPAASGLAVMLAGGSAFAGPNLLSNGDFAGAVTTSDTDYTIPSDCVYNGATSCQVPETTVFVNTDPHLDHPSWASFSTTGSGNDNANMLVVNGGGNASLAVWKQSLGVTADETYQFTGWAASNYATNPGVLEALFNGVSAGGAFTVTQVGSWAEFTFDWYSGAATTLNLGLVDTDIQANGNDFALTNFALVQTSVPEPASVAALIIGLSTITVMRLRRRRG